MILGSYKELNQHTNLLANFLRRKNFAAQARPALGGVSNYVVMAKNANFGWVGKHGLLITPEFGPSNSKLSCFLDQYKILKYFVP